MIDEAKQFLAPELVNRLSGLLVFSPLSKEVLADIFRVQYKEFSDQWKTKEGIKLPKFTKERIAKIIDKIYDPQFGTRPIERYIHQEIEPQLIQQVIDKELATA
ncbi:MAG: ATP-dependent Clp protease ATP-binding subunit [Candidatus Peribacteria bacterium]|nr:MAG: ATP-dependent Clp protease ATP-binding subunit [Candidatus Peribacteria bacterium]